MISITSEWKVNEFVLSDPDGNLLRFGEHLPRLLNSECCPFYWFVFCGHPSPNRGPRRAVFARWGGMAEDLLLSGYIMLGTAL